MNRTLRFFVFSLLLWSTEGFGVLSTLKPQLTIKSCTKFSVPRTIGQNAMLSMKAEAVSSLSRRLFLGAALPLTFGLTSAQKSSAAALSGADPEDKVRLVKAAKVISDIEGDYLDPEKWSDLVKLLSQVMSVGQSLSKSKGPETP
jgi:hypothetical protein